MKCTKLIAALLAMLMLFMLPMYAAQAAAEAAAETIAEAATEEPASDNRMLLGVMLLSTVFAALVISTLVFKGRDHTKYL